MRKSTNTQFAAFLERPQKTLVREVPLTKPQHRQVLVRLQGCGICASNLSVWEGRPWFAYPREAGAPGHEGWGIVEAVGESVRDIEIGQRVTMLSGHAYAEFDMTSSDWVIPLPEELDDEPFPAQSFGRAINAFERSGIVSGQLVAIVGDGFVELLLAQLAADAGAHVVVFSHRKDTLELAEAMDAEETVELARNGDDARRALQVSGRRGFDCVIELSGTRSSLELASAIVAERASLVTDFSCCEEPLRATPRDREGRQMRVVNAQERSMGGLMSSVRKAIQAALEGRLDPFPLLTHTVSLKSLDQGFRLLHERPQGFVKALMVNDMAA
jgi:threonine dehydrogenase-like Zn-dependent dehydrogenase